MEMKSCTWFVAVGYTILPLLNVICIPVRIEETYTNEESTAIHGTESTANKSGLKKSSMMISHVNKESSGSVFESHSDPMSMLQSFIRLKRKSENTGAQADLEKKLQGEKDSRASIPLVPKAESTTEAAGSSVPGLSQVPGLSSMAGMLPGSGGGGEPFATVYFGSVVAMPLSQNNMNNMMSALQTGQQFIPGMPSMPAMPNLPTG